MNGKVGRHKGHRAMETHRTNCFIRYIHSFHIRRKAFGIQFLPTNFLPYICPVSMYFFFHFIPSIGTCLRAPTKVQPVMSIPCLIWYTFVEMWQRKFSKHVDRKLISFPTPILWYEANFSCHIPVYGIVEWGLLSVGGRHFVICKVNV